MTNPTQTRRRILYYYDGWGPFLRGGKPENLCESIDILADSQITTVLLSPNIGQSVSYPSEVSQLSHWRPLSPETEAALRKGMGPFFTTVTHNVADLWRTHKVDSFRLMTDHARKRGLEVFTSIRMNDTHMLGLDDGNGPYTDPFYREHPEWRIPPMGGAGRHSGGALNYAIPEVRRHRLELMEELLRRYDFTGLELDFVRGPPFFLSDRPELEQDLYARFPRFPRDLSEKGIPIMNGFVREVREMANRIGREKGIPIAVCARVPSTLSGCRRVGLDPAAWHRDGCLDFLTVARFLQIWFDYPLADFRNALPGLPVHACIEHIVNAKNEQNHNFSRDASPEALRGAVASAYAQGASGITLYNLFVTLGKSPTPDGRDFRHPEPVEVFHEIGATETLEGTDKLYLVDATFPFFDLRFWDSHAPLPAGVTPDSPLITSLIVGEAQPGSRHIVLRVVLASSARDIEVAVQLNGVTQGRGRIATTPHLFVEPYDECPPSPDHCIDFEVDGSALAYGRNEVALMASRPATVVGIELAVRTA
ncbi:MAG: hypothetical protein R3F07_15540 [Opitutaceae bacterium]